MPTVSNRGASIYYATDGDAEGPPVVFVADAGLGGWSWGWQHAALAGPFETVVWDLRGTGRSTAPAGPYDLETLVSDLEAVCRAAGHRHVHLVGLGLGGAIALEAAHRTGRVETLTLIGTAAHGDAFDLDPLLVPVDDDGDAETAAAVTDSLEYGLSEPFRTDHPDVFEGIVDWRLEGDAGRTGLQGQLGALEAFDVRDRLFEITQPALVFHGTADELVSPAAGKTLAGGLPRGEFVPLEGAGHLATIELSRVINDRLFDFLEYEE
ncbi:alpha/beta fold hydrolase [Natrialbaceae archaeon A-chndr2]